MTDHLWLSCCYSTHTVNCNSWILVFMFNFHWHRSIFFSWMVFVATTGLQLNLKMINYTSTVYRLVTARGVEKSMQRKTIHLPYQPMHAESSTLGRNVISWHSCEPHTTDPWKHTARGKDNLPTERLETPNTVSAHSVSGEILRNSNHTYVLQAMYHLHSLCEKLCYEIVNIYQNVFTLLSDARTLFIKSVFWGVLYIWYVGYG